MTLWNCSVFTPVCPACSYRFGEFRDGDSIGDGVAVSGVVHKNTRQEHGSQVVSVKNIQGQSGGGCASVGGVWSAVLEDEKKSSISVLNSHREFVANVQWDCTLSRLESIEHVPTTSDICSP